MKTVISGRVVELNSETRKSPDGREYVSSTLRLDTGYDYIDVTARPSELFTGVPEGSRVTLRVEISNDSYPRATQPRVVADRVQIETPKPGDSK